MISNLSHLVAQLFSVFSSMFPVAGVAILTICFSISCIAGKRVAASHYQILMTECGEKTSAILRDGMVQAKASPETLQLRQQELIDK